MTIGEMLNEICALEEAILNTEDDTEDDAEKESLLQAIAAIREKLEQ